MIRKSMDRQTVRGHCSSAGVGQVHQEDGRPLGARRLAFDVLASKLRLPMLRPGTVRRSSLIERLAGGDQCPVVSVTAPAGYGKTELLAQWGERNGQAFAWVSIDEKDNDAKVLLSYIALALDAVEPLSGRVFDALASPGSSVPGSVVPRLASAFSSMSSPVVLVLDDVHLLHNSECRAAVSVLADHVPDGSRLVLAGRAEPPLPIARLRAGGRIAEFGLSDLSLTREEAASLLREAGLSLGEADVAELYQRTEGWPAGLYLAALYLREGGSLPGTAGSFAGDDRLVSEYVESEFLSRIPERQRTFLTQAAVLERMCGPLCDAVLGMDRSAATLADLARSNLLLVPLDRRKEWYRYHHLFRDMLLTELRGLEPDLVPVLRGRAASWCLRNDLPEEALEYSMGAGDVDTAAGLVERLWLPTYRQGRVTTIQRWLQWLDDRDGVDGHLMLAVLASLMFGVTGRPAEVERWADRVDRWQNRAAVRSGNSPAAAWAAVLRAIMCRHGVEQMCADADEAVQRFAAANIVAPVPALLQGIARVLSGDLEGGDAALEDAVSTGEETSAHETLAEALAERSLVAMAQGEWNRAEVLADRASSVCAGAGIESPFVCAVRARADMHRGDVPSARQHLVHAQRLRPVLTYAMPHVAVQARVALAHVYLALADKAGARTVLREIDGLLKRRPGLGTLVGEAQALRRLLSRERGAGPPGSSALTAAELRLLPMMSTHLSYPEIAGEMLLSLNTIRSQATSIYRKLRVSTRSQAVARSRDLGLIDR
jgi:LuxR family transcriptional regulator, maltose regulon positive regulatory protein